MILYVNGDSHTAAAEAVNPYAFAEDDNKYFYMGRVAHPDNLAVSWGKLLSLSLRSGFYCAAESASSNSRIMRTTREWLANRTSNNDVLVIIQWSTWEREEWLIDGTYYQINASGIDNVPISHQQQYKEYIDNVDWLQSTEQAHTLKFGISTKNYKLKTSSMFSLMAIMIFLKFRISRCGISATLHPTILQ